MLYVLVGDPIPLARARIGHGARRMFDIQKEAKLIAGINLRNQHGDAPLYSGPLHMDITFYLKMPKLSTSARDKRAFTYHFYKPDLSNMIKFIEDVGSHVLYHDDAQIALLTCRKVYHEEPRTEFTIEKINKEEKYQL